MNYCRNCIRKERNAPPSKCPECGKTTLRCELVGASVVSSCTNCGFGFAGGSFFPQCVIDHERRYTVSVSAAGKPQYLFAAKAFGMNAVELKRNLDNGRALTRDNLSPGEAAELIRRLRDAGLPYRVTPDLTEEYPEILCCTWR